MRNWTEYEKHADLKTEYGARKENEKWIVTLWHPFAQNVNLVIFDAKDQNKEVQKIKGDFKSPNWVWVMDENLDGAFYQYEITQEDGTVNLALDPFAKSMAAFNWEGKEKNIGKAAFVDFPKIKNLYKLNKINEPQPIIYEAHVRDITSLRKDVEIPGSFNALKEIKFAEHLKDLNVTHVQFLPIHNCYALNEFDKTIIDKGKGSGWETNYNWGYDPHNYFSINGWYSSNSENPYSRMEEFKDLVSYMHSKDIKVINDVVYNHIFDNDILHNVIPGYYFRDESKNKPVNMPAVASERLMARRIIVDSLKYYVEHYDVDGFRFDLSCYTDKETIEILTKELRAVKPNIVLHGEAWDWTDLPRDKQLIKGLDDNKLEFAYFNDTSRNAIKGEDDGDGFAPGLIGGNMKEFGAYLSAIIGNIKKFKPEVPEMSTAAYDRFTNTPNVVLNYAACHDGHTMWDKVNLTTEGDKATKFEAFRQVLLMQQLLPGRTLFLEGTELLYTKPNDRSGQDGDRCHKSGGAIDLFGFKNDEYNENTYRTTDYSNGLRWDNLSDEVKTDIFEFMSQVNKFRLNTPFFNISTTDEINNAYKFNYVSSEQGIIDFSITVDNQAVRVIHNFKDEIYKYETSGKILFNSKLGNTNVLGTLEPKSTILIKL